MILLDKNERNKEMPLDTTLLDLDRAPTILEMRAFFKKHDWSAAKISDRNQELPRNIRRSAA
jgi:hypothetical protein